jgi:hypothetical protein
MKHVKLFESNSYDEYQYNRFYKELDYYITFFRDVMGYNGEIGRIVKIDEFIKDSHKSIGIVLTKETKRILISIGENNRVLVHYYALNITQSLIYHSRKVYSAGLMTNYGNLLYRGLLYLLKESKIKGFNPILRVLENDEKSLSEGHDGSNLLGNIFCYDFTKYNFKKHNPIEGYDYLVPYFIFFSSNDVIKAWWDKTKNSELVYRVSDAIINDSDAYGKFKSIIDDDITDSSSMSKMGFSD